MRKIFGILLIGLLISCGDEGLRDPISDEIKEANLDRRGFHAVDFPTPSNGSWTYRNLENGREFTRRIEDTRFIGGLVYRKFASTEMPLFSLPLDKELPIDLKTEEGEPINNYEGVFQALFDVQERIYEDERLAELSPLTDEDRELLKEDQQTLKSIISAGFGAEGFSPPANFTVVKKEDLWEINENFEQPFMIRKVGNYFEVATRETFSNLPANGLAFRQKGEYLAASIPVKSTYFFKTTNDYQESAFDAYLSIIPQPIYNQSYFIPRKLWSFPMLVDKEWIVFEKVTNPTILVTKKVIEDNVSITVPAGTFDNAYLIEETTLLSGEPPKDVAGNEILPAKYWIVPGVGVVKYEYDRYIRVKEAEHYAFELIEYNLPQGE